MVRRKPPSKTPTPMAKRGVDRDVWDETPHTPERIELTEIDSIIKTPPFHSRGGRTSPTWDEYHSEEYFDINPKTDYTYAHSVSYNPHYIDEPDIIPNMSRNRISSHASGYTLHTSGLASPSPYSSDSKMAARRRREEAELERSRLEEEREERRRLDERRMLEEELEEEDERRRILDEERRSSSASYSRVTYSREGMVLRSGSRLSGVGSYLERNNNQRSSSTSQTSSSLSLARSLNSEFDVDSSKNMQHSTPISHLYAKNSKQEKESRNELSVSSIFSPSRIVKTVVTTETTEYIDSEGRRVRRSAEEKEGAKSGWFSGIKNMMRGSQNETLTETPETEMETANQETDEQQTQDGGWLRMFRSRTSTEEEARRAAEADDNSSVGKGGLFGIFSRSETSVTEEEEARRQAETDNSASIGKKGLFGIFSRSETTVTEEEEARRQAETDNSASTGKKGLFGIFSRSETTVTEEEEARRQAESAASNVARGGLFGMFSRSQTTVTEEEEEEARRQALAAESDSEMDVKEDVEDHPSWGNRFKNLLSRSTEEKWQTESVKETDMDIFGTETDGGWFGWLRIKNSKNEEKLNHSDAYENQNGDESKTGWFGWKSTDETTDLSEPVADVDQMDGDSKSRLFSWLGRSNEEKVTEDMNQTEDKEATGWFSWFRGSNKERVEETPNKTRKRKGRRVMFSLDSEGEEIEGDLKSGASSSFTRTTRSSRSGRSSRSSYRSEDSSRTFMQLLLSVITTVSSFISGIFRPITHSYAYRQTKVVIWRKLRVADMWIVSRPVGGCCCLCLPLLLLLPLLLGYLYGGDLLEQARASVKSFAILSANETHARPLPYIDPSTINVKIQQFFEEHQHRYEMNQLTERDVQRITQGLLSTQLEQLRLALLQDINSLKGEQVAAKTSHVNSVDSLKIKLADFINKYQSLENDIAALRSTGNVQIDSMKQDYSDQINILEQQIKSLGEEIASLQTSHLELLASVKNCCRNDSFYAMAVRKHVQDIFAQMMAGGPGTDEGYGAFLQWLQANYARKEDMDAELVKVSESITQRILAITKEQASSVYIQSNTQQGPAVSEDYIRWVVDDALQKFSADQVGMADYALESAGGSVLSVRCSETYYKKTALVSVFGIPLWYTTNSPRTVIQPDVHPGQCWAFKGARGFMVLQLAFPIKPSGFTLEHIPKALSPTGNIDSAPREFAVYGLNSENDKVGVSLGNYTYSESGKPIQYFPVQAPSSEFFELVELKVLGNHGNPEYTCIYRFRVHGIPYKPS